MTLNLLDDTNNQYVFELVNGSKHIDELSVYAPNASTARERILKVLKRKKYDK